MTIDLPKSASMIRHAEWAVCDALDDLDFNTIPIVENDDGSVYPFEDVYSVARARHATEVLRADHARASVRRAGRLLWDVSSGMLNQVGRPSPDTSAPFNEVVLRDPCHPAKPLAAFHIGQGQRDYFERACYQDCGTLWRVTRTGTDFLWVEIDSFTLPKHEKECPPEWWDLSRGPDAG